MKALQYTLLFIILGISSYFSFILAPPIEGLGDSSRILYLHVPAAWMSALAFVSSGICAGLYLFKHKEKYALLMHNGAELGMMFITGALISGSIWAETAWGTFWNWDPRETSVVLIMLIYCGYFAIPVQKSKTHIPRAAYLVISGAVMPFFMFIIPRLYFSLHPSTVINSSGSIHLSPLMRLGLFSSLFAYTLLFIAIYRLSYRASRLSNNKEIK